MFLILNCFTINVLIGLLFILKCGLLLQDKSVYAFETSILSKNQDELHINNKKKNAYKVSEHVYYRLYTRDRPNGHLLNRNNTKMMVVTTLNATNPIKVLVHGWLGSVEEKKSLCDLVMRAYLQVGEFNMICVEWMQFAYNINYAMAKHKAKHIGHDIAKILKMITHNMTVGVERIHLLGHGLGAHIVGFTGKKLLGKIPRITGLDPALPWYEKSRPNNRIDKKDAKFVDIIHTSMNHLGMSKSLGHIDFFPNGGESQPKCRFSDKVTGGACSHNKVNSLFAKSIVDKENFKAFKCDKWDECKFGECTEQGESTYMGENVDKMRSGNYCLLIKHP